MNAPIHKNKLESIQAEVTGLIVEQLKQFEETGTTPRWLQPWDANGSFSWPVNLEGTPYSGINVMVLLACQEKLGFQSSTWGTYRNFQKRGSQVLKGERATKIFFYKTLTIEDKNDLGQVNLDEKGNPVTQTIPMLKHFSVFNLSQTNLKQSPAIVPSENFKGLADAIQTAGVDIRHGVDKAYYDRVGDFVRMPNMDQFKEEAHYWATIAHEAIHWTGATNRLNRTRGKLYGDESYAMEELVAELGSVMLLAQFGIKPQFQSAIYLNGWVKAFEGDHKLIFKVAAQAQKAMGFLTTK